MWYKIGATHLFWREGMIVFHSDLDNTLVYSYKHDIGEKKKCVEIYQGREISFMTEESYELLKKVKEKVLFVPTTTRTVEQYNRINLGIGVPEYALVCNGGVLLVNGKSDEKWYHESIKLTEGCTEELNRAGEYLERDTDRIFEVRNIEELFLFTKSKEPIRTIRRLEKLLDLSKMDVFCNGVKVYVIPKLLNKGEAVRRFRKRVKAEHVLAAGDSEFDVPMLREAETAIAPRELKEKYGVGLDVEVMRESVFSDELLRIIMRWCE